MYIEEDGMGHQAKDVAKNLKIDLLIDLWSFLSALDFFWVLEEGKSSCIKKGTHMADCISMGNQADRK